MYSLTFRVLVVYDSREM